MIEDLCRAFEFSIAFRTAIPFEFYHDMQNMQGTYYHKSEMMKQTCRGWWLVYEHAAWQGLSWDQS